MSNMISLDLGRAIRPLQVCNERIRQLKWMPHRGFAVADLLTPGPKHAVLIETTKDVSFSTVAETLKLWWEPSVVLVLRGLVEHHWRRKEGNAGVYGWQRIRENELFVLPPESTHPRYHVRHGPEWVDPVQRLAKEDSLFLLISTGCIREARERLLDIELEGLLAMPELKLPSEPLRSVAKLEAEALLHEEGPSVALGIYRHHARAAMAFPHGMVSLSLAAPTTVVDVARPHLTIAGPHDVVPPPMEDSWSMDAMFF